jgi:hypothetical protein
MPTDPAPSFGALLRQYRRAAGLTQEELASWHCSPDPHWFSRRQIVLLLVLRQAPSHDNLKRAHELCPTVWSLDWSLEGK